MRFGLASSALREGDAYCLTPSFLVSTYRLTLWVRIALVTLSFAARL